MKKLLLLIALIHVVSSVHAQQTTFNVAFGILTNADGTTPAANGSLVQFIAAPTVGELALPSSTSFISGNEILLWSGGLDSSTNGDIAGSMFTAVTVTVPQNYVLMLQWFPTLNAAAASPGNSTPFGQFSYANDVSWIAPAAGSTVNISFLTDTVFSTGTADSFGYASLTTAAVPEPATYAMFAGVLALGLTIWRRRHA